MIQLAWPWMWLLLPLPWLLTRALPPSRPQGAALFLPFAAGLAADGVPNLRAPPRARQVLFVAIWLLVLGAASRPQWLGEPEPVPSTGRRLLLAVDVSGSMAAQDMAGGYTRLQVVQAVAGEFIQRRHGDQVGLILFGSRPYLQAPLTADLDTVSQFLHETMIGVAGKETAVGDAIGLAIKRLREDAAPTRKKGDTVLILLTDGRSNAGALQPLQAASLAAADGLRVYTIGVGALDGSGFLGLGGGNSDLDEDTLRSIAQATGGEYFRAGDASDLQKVYAQIDRLEPGAGLEQWFRPSTEWFPWPLAAALLLSVPAVVLRAGSWR
ncbi:MAG: VWA domain-containing protein [Panacagrimonas sp.]